MKKLLAILLALVLVLVNVVAFAEGVVSIDTGYDQETNAGGLGVAAQTVEIEKNITATTYKDTDKTPAHTLEFVVDKGTVTEATTITEAPVVDIDDLELKEGDTSGKIKINLPEYKGVGIYTYPVTETDTNVAGFTYAKKLELKVTVVQTAEGLKVAGIAIRQDDEKTDTIENAYDAGALKISKTVTGNLGDYNADWVFDVVLTAPEGDTVLSTVPIVAKDGIVKDGDTEITSIAPGWTEKELTVTLKHDQNVEFDNLPAGVTYTVVEREDSNYKMTETFSNDEKKITAKTLDTADFENNREIEVDTGVTMETAAYIMILALVLIGAAVLFVRKREEY